MRKVELREAQNLMTTILKDFDKLCKDNGLQYWIESGTLLGAKRHGGFIPWDDDIDVSMMREDYKKFIEIVKEKLPDDLYYQDITTEDGITYGWAKVRHRFSKIVEEEDAKYSEGMFIDIFPYDYYSSKDDEKLRKKSEFIKNLKLVYNSNLKYEKNMKKNMKRFICKVYNKIILKKTIKDVVVDAKNYADKITSKEKEFLGQGPEVLSFNDFYKTSTIFPLKTINFEGIEVSAPNNVEEYLEVTYGKNYMELPKEEDRYSHNLNLFIEKNR